MANVYTNPILRTECIGNSLNTINTNFTSLDEGIVNVNSTLEGQIATTQNNLVLSATNLTNQINSAFKPLAFVLFRYQFNTQNVVSVINNNNITPPNSASFRQILRSFNISNVIRQTNTRLTVNFDTPILNSYITLISHRNGYPLYYTPYTLSHTSNSFNIELVSSPTGAANYEMEVLVF